MRESAVKENPIHFHEQIDISELIKSRQDITEAISSLTVDLTAKRENSVVIVDGQLNTELVLVCGRWLNEFNEKMLIAFHEVFVRKSDAASDAEENDMIVVSED